jgi:cyclase
MYTINGTIKSERKLEDFLIEINEIGIGELVINSIDRDGTELGYDIQLIEQVRKVVDVPITVIGGASSHQNIRELIQKFKIIGAAAGSLFVFKGKYKAVLISYPNKEEKKNILS